MAKVSVIIPNHNHARYLRQRIESVLQQTFQDSEVILLDDCFTDENRCGDWSLLALMTFEGRITHVAEPLNYNREHHATVRSKTFVAGLGAQEHLGMVRWVLERVTPPKDILEGAYVSASYLWAYSVLNRRPFRFRWGLLREAMRTDPRALQRLVRRALAVVPRKLKKEFRLLRQRRERHASG